MPSDLDDESDDENGASVPSRPPGDAAPWITGDALRSHQANERTLLAWMRSGVAMIGLGFLIARVTVAAHEYGAADSARLSAQSRGTFWVGVALAAAGAVLTAAATLRYAAVRRSIIRNEVSPPGGAFVVAAATIAAVAGAALVAMLVTSR